VAETRLGEAPSRILVGGAALVILIAGIQAASSIVTPLLVAIFLAAILESPVDWIARRRVPRWIAVLLVMLATVSVIVGLGAVIGASAAAFYSAIPHYQARLDQHFTQLLSWLQGYGLAISRETVLASMDVGKTMQVIGGLLSGLGVLVSNGFLILLVVVFILLEGESLARKLHGAFGRKPEVLGQLAKFLDSFKVYVAIKTLTSLATGALVWGMLKALGVDFASVWGLMAFAFNYIPNLGSILAAVPAVLLAWVQFGPGKALAVALGYLVVNNLLGVVVEPRLMGRGVGLSPLVVFLSLILWAWVLGPVGMVLAVPLMVGVKLALEIGEGTRWLAILMGPATDIGAPNPGEGDPGARG